MKILLALIKKKNNKVSNLLLNNFLFDILYSFQELILK